MSQLKQKSFAPEYKKKSVRSYVVRAGRMTEGQLKALEEHWPRYGLSLFEGQPGPWAKVFEREAPVVLEIGFGMGASLLQMAIAEPDKDFIGIEVYPPGVGRLLATAAEEGVSNLRVYLADAVDVLDDCIAAESLARAQIYFPDPWHKKKHHKRRLVQTPLIEKLESKLVMGGVLHLATDWQAYAEHMVEVLEKIPGLENIAECGPYNPRPAYRPETKFERRGLALGHGVWDLLYRRVSRRLDA